MSQHCWIRERKEFSLKSKTNSASSVKLTLEDLGSIKTYCAPAQTTKHLSFVKTSFINRNMQSYPQLVRKEKDEQLSLSPQ